MSGTNLNIFFTPLALPGAQTGAQTGALAGLLQAPAEPGDQPAAGNGVPAFMDMIFARLAELSAAAPENAGQDQDAAAANPGVSVFAPPHKTAKNPDTADAPDSSVPDGAAALPAAVQTPATLPPTAFPEEISTLADAVPADTGLPLPADAIAAADGIPSPGDTDGDFFAPPVPLFPGEAPDTAAAGTLPETDGDVPSAPAQADALPTESPAPGKGRPRFLDVLETLLQGIPAESRPDIITIPPGLVRRDLEKLQFNPEQDGAEPALVATGLTPEKLAALLDSLDTEQANDGTPATVFIVGIVKILPPEAKREAIFIPRAIIIPKPAAGAATAATAATAAASKPAPAATEGTAAPPSPGGATAASLNSLLTPGDGQSLPAQPEGFERILQILEQAREKSAGYAGNAAASGSEKTGGTPRLHSPALSAVPEMPQTARGDLMASAAWSSIFPDGFDFAPGHARAQAVSLNGPALMTSLIGNAPQAAVPHPATQAVAVTVAKTAASGESRNIVIKLDPPELGRVEIRLDFGAEKRNGLKTHLLVEKPETYLMLQRDAHVLERMLQDISADGGGALSFELSQDGSGFENDGRGGGNDSGGGNGDAGGGEEIVETTMNWYVDPDTGRTRYDLLV